MLGIAGTSFMGIEKDFALKPGESGTLKNYQFTYMKTDITQNSDHTNIKAIMQIEKNGKSLGQYTTSKSYYPKFDMNSTKAGILNFGLEDFYFSQSIISDDNSAVFEVKINPLVSLIWTFNDKFWTYITKDRKHEITNFIDYSDYELDLNSIITDYQSGVLDKKEFNDQLNSFQEIINKSSINKNTRLRIEQLLENVNSN